MAVAATRTETHGQATTLVLLHHQAALASVGQVSVGGHHHLLLVEAAQDCRALHRPHRAMGTRRRTLEDAEAGTWLSNAPIH